jgi:hypothetical protein
MPVFGAKQAWVVRTPGSRDFLGIDLLLSPVSSYVIDPTCSNDVVFASPLCMQGWAENPENGITQPLARSMSACKRLRFQGVDLLGRFLKQMASETFLPVNLSVMGLDKA